jgi:tetratricopeptide (TPR) repeat protein
MKINLIILLISFFSTGLYAQLDDNLKAKLYFTEAEKLFKQGDFKNSLVYVDKAEVTLGAPVARTLALRIKLAYNLGKFTQAKELFDTYTSKYMDGASKELNDEVLSMFVNIEEAAEAEKNRLYITVNGKKIEVAKEDLGKMSWDDAYNACKRLGNGWRLPTKDELAEMYYQLHKKGKGNFKSAFYWSSTELATNDAWYFTFGFGSASSGDGKYYPLYVRAVRAF